MKSNPLGDLLHDWITRPGRNMSRLSEGSGVSASLLNKYIDGRVRPTPRNLERLAGVLGVEYEYLMRVCGYLPSASEEERPEPALKDKQDAIAESYRAWMGAMTPTMGEMAAHELFWRPFLAEAQRAREEAERAKDLEERIIKAVNAARVQDVKNGANAESHAPNSGEAGLGGSLDARQRRGRELKTLALAGR